MLRSLENWKAMECDGQIKSMFRQSTDLHDMSHIVRSAEDLQVGWRQAQFGTRTAFKVAGPALGQDGA